MMMYGGYGISDLEKVFEETSKQLRVESWKRIEWRAKNQNLSPKYKGMLPNGDIVFQTNSGTYGPNIKWTQRIRFKDLSEALTLFNSDDTWKRRDVIDLLISGNLMVECNDPSWKYYFSYKGWSRGYGLTREIRYPKIRNKYLTGCLCKHLFSVLSALPFYRMDITRDATNLGLLNKSRKW